MPVPFFLFALLALLIKAPLAYAQDRIITSPELVQFYQNLALKEKTLLDMNRHALNNTQEKDLASEIASHYSDDVIMKLSFFGVENQRLVKVKAGKFSKESYTEALLKTYEDPRHVELYIRVGKMDLKGERATVNLTYSRSYDMKLDHEEDMISASWHVQEQSECTDKVQRTAKGGLEIRHSTCETRFKITKFESKIPEALQSFSPRTSGYFLASAM